MISYSGLSGNVREVVRASIEQNFQRNGRFGSGIFGGGNGRWLVSHRAAKQGGQTLQDTGQLAASLQVQVKATGGLSVNEDGMLQTTGEIEVKVGSNKTTKTGHNLAQIHHFGARPRVTEKSRKFFIAKYAETKDSFWLGMARTKKKEFDIPARPFLVMQDEDIQKISNVFIDYLSRQ